uniref:Transposase n=1 Tax=Steinernema glaseri TaxID=37863 RepID=A0A1I7ZPE5_9BILA
MASPRIHRVGKTAYAKETEEIVTDGGITMRSHKSCKEYGTALLWSPRPQLVYDNEAEKRKQGGTTISRSSHVS